MFIGRLGFKIFLRLYGIAIKSLNRTGYPFCASELGLRGAKRVSLDGIRNFGNRPRFSAKEVVDSELEVIKGPRKKESA